MRAAPRAFDADDWIGVNALHRSVAWPERSEAGWAWLRSNPAAAADPGRPVGWVVDDDGPAGFVGNFVQTFWVDQAPRLVASGHSIVVSPRSRGAGRALIAAFLAQPGLAAAYTFNANPLSAPLMPGMGLQPWPPKTGALKLSWTIDPVACAAGRLNRTIARGRHREPPPERLVNARMGAAPPLRLADDLLLLTDLSDGSAFADFWRRLKRQHRVVMDRSPETLRWRLADPDQVVRPLLIARRDGADLTGYLWALLSKDDPGAAPSLDIIDIVSIDTDPAAPAALLKAVLDNARGLGAAKVRLQVVSPERVDQLGEPVRRARREGGWGHCHVRFGAEAEVVSAHWRPTPFDGDYSFCLRPAPSGRRPSA